jgi:hypothetical protein
MPATSSGTRWLLGQVIVRHERAIRRLHRAVEQASTPAAHLRAQQRVAQARARLMAARLALQDAC